MRTVVLHTRHTLAGLRGYQAKFYHQLATIAYAQRQSVAPCIEGFKRLPSLLVPAETRSPALGRAKHVAIGKASAEHYHTDILQRLGSAHQVCHTNVLDIKTGQI